MMRHALARAVLHASVPLLLLASLIGSIRLTEHRDWLSDAAFWSIRLLLLGSCFLLTSGVFYFTVIRGQAGAERADGPAHRFRQAATVIYSLLISFLALEAVFMFIPRSHGVGYSLAAQTWHRYYWRPVNQYGYRDRPFDPGEAQGGKLIFALGDSFTAGWGIDSVSDRYSDQLQSILPASYRVVNLGRNASDTRNEFKRLLEFPARPDVLILQYYGNDIEEVLRDAGMPIDYTGYQGLPRFIKGFVMGSYAANFVYWQFPHGGGERSGELLLDAYRDHRLLSIHLDDLYGFVDFSHRNRVPLAVVIFPFLRALDASRVFIAPVRHFFSANGAEVIDVSALVKDLPERRRVVNGSDDHASVEVHRLVAQQLRKVLEQRGWVNAGR